MTYEQFAKDYLTPPVRARFLKNLQPNNPRFYANKPSIASYAYYGFYWSDTPEGFGYWDRIYWNIYRRVYYDI